MIGTMLAVVALLAGAVDVSGQSAGREKALWSGSSSSTATVVGQGADSELQQQDGAEALYREGRSALSSGRYSDAIESFRSLRERYPRSTRVPDSYYWEAFARSRMPPSLSSLRQAQSLLRTQAERYPDAATSEDAEVLLVRVQSQLAQLGDAAAAEEIRNRAGEEDEAESAHQREPRSRASEENCGAGEDQDARLAALNALMTMDAQNAIPILRRVLARRDRCSAQLRRQAVFILSQQHSAATEDDLLSVARTDPDADVRGQAVFWLSQVGGERSLAALDSILNTSDDEDLARRAIFSISQHGSQRAIDVLRRFIERSDRPEELRAQAIFWLGQHEGGGEYLRGLYQRITSTELKSRIVAGLAQGLDAAGVRFLMQIVQNDSEPVEARRQAVFWMGQSRQVRFADLADLYRRLTSREVKEQIVFVYSQRRETEAVDALMDIARSDPDRELRRRALFWLGQSHDPRAARFLLDIIER